MPLERGAFVIKISPFFNTVSVLLPLNLSKFSVL
nr:MAG TPA: hypothetical protein [Caudoviricetes sp.]